MYLRERGWGSQKARVPMIYPAGTPLHEMKYEDCLVCGAEWHLSCEFDSEGNPIMETIGGGSRSCAGNCGNVREFLRLLKEETEREREFNRRMRRYDDPRDAISIDHVCRGGQFGHCWCGRSGPYASNTDKFMRSLEPPARVDGLPERSLV